MAKNQREGRNRSIKRGVAIIAGLLCLAGAPIAQSVHGASAPAPKASPAPVTAEHSYSQQMTSMGIRW